MTTQVDPSGQSSQSQGAEQSDSGYADNLSVLGVPIKTADWMPDGDVLFIYNGVDNIVKLDGTNKEVRYETKKPRWVLVHTGKTKLMKRLSQRISKTMRRHDV